MQYRVEWSGVEKIGWRWSGDKDGVEGVEDASQASGWHWELAEQLISVLTRSIYQMQMVT